MIIVYNTLNQ